VPTASRRQPSCTNCQVGKLSGAVVDVCRGHGTFLDAGELHHIVTFIQNGGLDRARAQQFEHLRDEERRLQDLQRKAMRESGHGAAGGGGGIDGGNLIDLIDLITGGR